MDNKLRKFLLKENILGKFSTLDLMAILFFSVTALIIRICLSEFKSTDWFVFLEPWTNGFKEQGFAYITNDQYNYTPLYMYFLWFTTKTGTSVLTQIKAFSAIFDFILALFASLIVNKITDKKSLSVLTYGIVLLTPTVIMNSAMWGQCDSIYVSMIAASFYFILINKPRTAMIVYGVSFCLKLQSIFFMPVLLVVWAFNNKVKLRFFLYIPAVYVISVIPALIAGRSFGSLMTVYIGQVKYYYDYLSYKYPNIYLLFDPGDYTKLYGKAAVWLTMGIMIVIAYIAMKKIKKSAFTPGIILQFSLLVLIAVPFFLPYMHDRYGYAADVFSVIFAACYPKKFYVPVLTVLSSFIAYTFYFSEKLPIPFWLLGFMNLIVILIVGYSFIKECDYVKAALDAKKQSKEKETKQMAVV